MKKILLILGGMLILFLLAFCCSYTIYQKTDSFSDDSYAVETITGKGRSGKRQEIQYDPISEEKHQKKKHQHMERQPENDRCPKMLPHRWRRSRIVFW